MTWLGQFDPRTVSLVGTSPSGHERRLLTCSLVAMFEPEPNLNPRGRAPFAMYDGLHADMARRIGTSMEGLLVHVGRATIRPALGSTAAH